MLAVPLFIVTLVPLTASLALQARRDVDDLLHRLYMHLPNLVPRNLVKSALLPRMPIEGPVVQPGLSTPIGTEPVPNAIQQPGIGSDSDDNITGQVFCPNSVDQGSLAIACVCALFGVLLNVWSVVVFVMGMREEKKLWLTAGDLQEQADELRKTELNDGQRIVNLRMEQGKQRGVQEVQAGVLEKRRI